MTQISPPFTTPHASLNRPAPSLRLTWRPPRASPRSSPPCCRPGVRRKSNMEGKMFCGLLTRSRSNSSYHRPPTHPEARQPLADALRGLLEALAPALPRVPVLFLANHTHHHVYGSSATDPSPEPKPHPLTPIHNRPHQTNKRTNKDVLQALLEVGRLRRLPRLAPEPRGHADLLRLLLHPGRRLLRWWSSLSVGV